MTKILISCGEVSGDIYAGALTTELVKLDPRVQVFDLVAIRWQLLAPVLSGTIVA